MHGISDVEIKLGDEINKLADKHMRFINELDTGSFICIPSRDANSSTLSEQIQSFFRQECRESDLFAKGG
jgi:hypothetical protein